MRWKGSLRVAAPTFLVSMLLFGLCTATATVLYKEQRATAEALEENIESRRLSDALEGTLENIVALLDQRSEQVQVLGHRFEDFLDEAVAMADKPEESRLLDQLERTWRSYEACLEHLGSAKEDESLRKAKQILEDESLPICQKLRRFNAAQIERADFEHNRRVRWMAWGLAGVGTVGSVAGGLLGYSVSRTLRKKIYQLSVHIRNAADRLGQDPPALTVTENGDLKQLGSQMKYLLSEIEMVVERLQQREREVLRAEQLAAVGQLAAGVAHELRNPLTAIKMLVQTMQEDESLQGTSAEDLSVIEREVRRMESSLQTFLDFSRPREPERRPIDLAEVVSRTFALMRGRAERQHVRLSQSLPAAALIVEADAEQLQQLLVNLVLNSLDAMPGGGKVEVEANADGEQIEVRVQDTGSGISSEVLPRLFEPFVSSKETGVGLGLLVSRRIAEAHGGTLAASNRPEGGASLVLRLPWRSTETHPNRKEARNMQTV